jgi:16S rRNA processing protein RimM
MSKKVLIAKVISAFGIKGEVKILSYAENPLNIEKYELFDAKGNSLKLKISNKNKAVIGTNASGEPIFIAKIEGVNDRTLAETLRGQDLFASRENFSKTKKDEFYYVDLIGLNVVDMDSKKIGKVLSVNDFGAGGMIEIEFDEADAKSNREKIENFPFKNAVFPEVDLEKNFIRLDMPEFWKDR